MMKYIYDYRVTVAFEGPDGLELDEDQQDEICDAMDHKLKGLLSSLGFPIKCVNSTSEVNKE